MKQMNWAQLTRDQAAEYLGKTDTKRRVGENTVGLYAKDMNDGRWKFDACPPIIILNPKGSVMDGNHRLSAFLASDLNTFPTWILNIRDPDAVLVLDTGKPRSLADQLELRGHAHARELQAMFNTAFKWKGGDIGRDARLTRTAQVRWVESNPNAAKAAQVTAEIRPHGSAVVSFPIGSVATLYDIACYAEGGDILEEFVTGATHGSITFPLLSRFQQRMADHSNTRNSFRMSPVQISYLTVRVYLAWLNDETNLTRLYGTRRVLADLPGWHDWLQAMWPERIQENN